MTENPLPDSLWEYLQNKYGATDAQQLSGGSINEAAKIITSSDSLFVKWNDTEAFPAMFELEARNLNLLRQTQTVQTPAVIEVNDVDNLSFLILDYVQANTKSFAGTEKLGEQIALLHQNTNVDFGLHYNNYIGILQQFNKLNESWADFFIENRLKPLVNKAYQMQLLDLEEMSLFVTLYQKIPTLFPDEKPALLHGDLWGGNYLITETGIPFVFDPACYFGHREMDIAMTVLFGGYDRVFYEAYHATFPLESGWQERTALWNLYPLLIHLLLFGKNYHNNLMQSVKKFV